MNGITRYALTHPRLVLLIEAIITIALVSGIPLTRTEVGYRTFLGDHHPAIVELDEMIETFGSGLPVFIAWECRGSSPCESVFDDASLQMQLDVVDRLESHALVAKIDSPATSPIVVSIRGDIEVRQYTEDGLSDADLQVLATAALDDPLWRGTLVSPDGEVGAMLVQLSSTESRVTAEIVPEIRDALKAHEDRGFEFYLVGDPVDFVVSGGQLQADTPVIVGVMLAFLIVAAWVLLRSLLSVGLAIGTAGVAVGWAMGAMSWLDWPEMEITQALRPGILVVALCTAIHVITRYAEHATSETDTTLDQRRSWIDTVTSEIGAACLLTALTTAAGFLSFIASGMSSFSQFGITAAIGVGAGLLLSFTALPILLVHVEPRRLRSNAVQDSWNTVLQHVGAIAERKPRLVFGASGILILVSLYGWSVVRVEVDERELFGENSEVVKWALFVEENLRKSDSLEVRLVAPENRSFLEPEGIEILEDVSVHLAGLGNLGQARSVLDLLRTTNRAAHDGDPEFARPGDTHAENAQLALLLEMAPGSPLDSWISYDRHARISLEADPTSTVERADTLEQARAYLDHRLPSGWTYHISGPYSVYLAFADALQRTQLRSFGSAAFIVALMLWIYFRLSGLSNVAAVKWTFVGMFPSILPVVVTLGAMGLFDVPLDLGTAMVGAVILGIAVDDSIHLITAYRRNRRDGNDSRKSIRDAISSTGQALVTSSIAISIGSFALMFSSWQSIASFGLLSGLAICAALVADLVVLPAILLAFGKPERASLRPSSTITDIPSFAARSGATLIIAIVSIATVVLLFDSVGNRFANVPLPCSIVANGAVSPFSVIDPACPLQSRDIVHSVTLGNRTFTPDRISSAYRAESLGSSVEYRIVRSGNQQTLTVPLDSVSDSDRTVEFALAALAVLLGLFIGLSVLWLSSAQAAIPFAILCVTLGITASGILTGSYWSRLPLPYLAAIAMAPAAMIHVALTFPKRSSLIQSSPGVLWFLYGIGASAMLSLVWEMRNHASVWEMVIFLAVIALGMGWLRVFAAGCSSQQDHDALEQHRARTSTTGSIVLIGLIGVTGLLTALSRTQCIALFLVLIPLPIGLSLVRHQFFDARPYARAVGLYSLSIAVYVGAVGVGIYAIGGAYETGSGLLQLGIAFMVLLVAEAIRFAVRSIAGRRLPTAESRLHKLELQFASGIRGVASDDVVGQTAAESLMIGLASTGVSFVMREREQWRIAAASGTPPPLHDGLDEIADFLSTRHQPVYLGPEGGEQNRYGAMLRGRQVAVAAPVWWNVQMVAFVLVSPPRDLLPYRKQEINFIHRICQQSAAAIHNARLTNELLHAERFATLDWIATGLMHSVGRPMTIISRSTQRLATQIDVPEAFNEFVEDVRLASQETLQGLRQLRTFATTGRLSRSAPQPAENIVERAVRVVSKLHDGAEITLRPAADLPLVLHGEDLQRVITSLLDNALGASGAKDPTPEVSVAFDGEALRFEVVDFGCGMTPDVLSRATDAFFTTRRDDGGSGIGLLDAKSTINRIGGSLSIESVEHEGTVVTITLPNELTVNPGAQGLAHIQ